MSDDAAATVATGPGETVRRLCAEQGRKHRWVAEQIGISKDRFYRLLRGDAEMSFNEAVQLAALFDVPLATFVQEGGDGAR